VARLRRSCPITALSMELVKFDTQLMQHAEISGIEYQQGTLAGYEIREYLLEKFGRRCVYCGVTLVPFEVEHIVPVARGGTSRIANLTLACHAAMTPSRRARRRSLAILTCKPKPRHR
jgi:5-methylcytosine-specific restriction endonuclease McrA